MKGQKAKSEIAAKDRKERKKKKIRREAVSQIFFALFAFFCGYSNLLSLRAKS